MTTILQLESPKSVEDGVEVAAVLRAKGKVHRLWWRFPAAWRGALTRWADPFVVGMLFLMMEAGEEVRIEGVASPSLLENLERYMAIWRVWDPKRYAVVPMRADAETEMPPAAGAEFIVTFSGGVDSCYTLARHFDGAAGRGTRAIGAALVIDGFDIWPEQENAAGIFAGLSRAALAQLATTPVPGILAATNFHELPVAWADAFGSELVSGLMLCAGRFRGVVLPNSQSYVESGTRWGSTPLADRYMGSGAFAILDDGAEVNRAEKIDYLARHPALLEHLRVCFPAGGRFENCCRCEKCLRTILAFHIAGVAVPRAAFPIAVTPRQIARMKFHSRLTWVFWRELLETARRRNVAAEPWAIALAAAVRRGARRHRLQQLKAPLIPLRNGLRTIFRGSPENRSRRKQIPPPPKSPS